MRDIKFRAWWPSRQEMMEPMTVQELATSASSDIPSEIVFMQYTGLKDKNGVEIYEGDFIKDINYLKGPAYEVKWDDDYVAFCPAWHGRKIGWRGEDFEVIGNIYENPELQA